MKQLLTIFLFLISFSFLHSQEDGDVIYSSSPGYVSVDLRKADYRCKYTIKGFYSYPNSNLKLNLDKYLVKSHDYGWYFSLPPSIGPDEVLNITFDIKSSCKNDVILGVSESRVHRFVKNSFYKTLNLRGKFSDHSGRGEDYNTMFLEAYDRYILNNLIEVVDTSGQMNADSVLLQDLAKGFASIMISYYDYKIEYFEPTSDHVLGQYHQISSSSVDNINVYEAFPNNSELIFYQINDMVREAIENINFNSYIKKYTVKMEKDCHNENVYIFTIEVE